MRKRLQQILNVALVGVLLAPLWRVGLGTADSQSPTFEGFTPSGIAQALTAGPDGNLWYADHEGLGNNSICSVTLSGNTALPCARLSYPSSYGEISQLLAGPDGNVWFRISFATPLIGVMSPSGTILAEYTLDGGKGIPSDMTIGSDGNLWFADSVPNADGTVTSSIDRMTTAGVITEFPVTTAPGESLGSVTAGPGGDLWFTESALESDGLYTNQIGRITTSGIVTQYPAVAGYYSGYGPLVAAPDGNMWFIETYGYNSSSGISNIDRITPAGTITEFPLPGVGSNAISMVSGPENSIWFTEDDNATDTGKVARIAMDGTITEYSLPDSSLLPGLITVGPDGNMWFSSQGPRLEEIIMPNSPTYLTATTPTNQHPALSWTAPADGLASSYNVYRNGSLIGSTTGTTYTDTGAVQGSYNYSVTAVDSGGHESLPSNTVNVVYTTTGPTIAITAPAVNSLVSGTVTVSGTITEPDQIQDGQVVVHLRAVSPSTGNLGAFLNTLYAPVNSDGTWSITFNSAAYTDGQYGVTALATDITGNSQTASGGASIKPFTIDNTRPTVNFTAPTSFAGPFTTGPVVAITASDNSGLSVMAIHVYTSSNQLLTTCGSATPAQLAAGAMSCNTSSLAPGTYYIKAGATDKAGRNMTVISPTFTITG